MGTRAGDHPGIGCNDRLLSDGRSFNRPLALLVALFFLGLGWNFAYVAGSTLLADQLSPGERAKTQGFNDLLLNLASAASQVLSGVVYAVGGYGVMALVAAAAALVPLAVVIWWQAAGRQIIPPRQP